jgi:hypothetical protein
MQTGEIMTLKQGEANPVILGAKIKITANGRLQGSVDFVENGVEIRRTLTIYRTSREDVETGKKLAAEGFPRSSLRQPEQGEIIVTIDDWDVKNNRNSIHHAKIGLSGEFYHTVRGINEPALSPNDLEEIKRWLPLNKLTKLADDIQSFVMKDPRGKEWMGKMEEKDRLFK